ncbi:response regulator [bacterium]|nr:MAG: response regulator [bacterium]
MSISISKYVVQFKAPFTIQYEEVPYFLERYFPSNSELFSSKKSHLDFIHIDDKIRVHKQFEQLKNFPTNWNIAYNIIDNESIKFQVIDHGIVAYNSDLNCYEGTGFIVNISSLVPYESDAFSRDINKAIHKHSLVSITNKKGIIIYANELFTRLSKYENHELLGKNHRIINSGFHSKEFWGKAWFTISKGDIWRGEICNRAKDGSLYWVDSIIHPIFDQSSCEVTHYVSIRRDITKLKEHEFELRTTRDHLERTAEVAMVGGWEVYPNSNLHNWSRVMRAIFEVDETFIPTDDNVLSFIENPIEQETFRTITQQSFQERKPFTHVHQIKTAKGNYKWVRAIGHFDETEPNLHRFYGTAQDITQTKIIDDKAKKQLYFKTILTDISSGFLKMSTDNFKHILENSLQKVSSYFNAEECLLILFHSENQFIDKVYHWNDLAQEFFESNHVQSAHQFPWTTDELKKSGFALIPDIDQFPGKHKQERELYKKLGVKSAVVFPLVKNDVIFGTIVLADTQEKLQWGETIKSELELVVNLFTDFIFRYNLEIETERAKVAAIEANKAKSDFLAIMSHEIRSPLNGVIGFNELIQKNAENSLIYKYATFAKSAANTLLELVNNVLDFTKIESNKLEFDFHKTNTFELIEQLLDIFRSQAVKKQLEIVLNIRPDLPEYLITDSTRLKQILINLVGNAIKFTDAGEIEIRAHHESLTPKKLLLHFTIRDTGIGIPTSYQEKLFKPFIQADGSISKRYGGSGLGLSISKSLIEQMGGRIYLHSEPNAGSTFTFYIEADSTSSEHSEPLNSIYKNALVVDNNTLSATVLKNQLEAHGVNTDISRMNEFNEKHFREYVSYDLILMDSRTPTSDNILTIQAFNEFCKNQGISAPHSYLLNATEELYTFSDCMGMGFQNQIFKPIAPLTFRELLKGNLISENWKQLTSDESGTTEPNEKPVTVLLVDDSAINLYLLNQVIQQVAPNCIIHQADSALKAFEMYESILPDFIFMDLQMPVISGYEASKKIRLTEKKLNHTAKIIAISADTYEEVSEQCKAAGIDSYIEKPIKLNDFLFLKTHH